jgi:hypothetical protein
VDRGRGLEDFERFGLLDHLDLRSRLELQRRERRSILLVRG